MYTITFLGDLKLKVIELYSDDLQLMGGERQDTAVKESIAG